MTCYPKADDTRPFGIDVSRYNLVDWRTVRGFAAPYVDFAMIRWGQGGIGSFDDIDRMVFKHWANAQYCFGHCRIMGYHVQFPGVSVKGHVDNVRRIGQLLGGYGDAPFWLDMELVQGRTGMQIVAHAGDVRSALEDLMGMEVGIYSGEWFIDKYKLPICPWWADTYWWLAQYGNNSELISPLQIPIGIPPEKVLYHQTTSKLEGALFGAPLGTSVDGNRMLNSY